MAKTATVERDTSVTSQPKLSLVTPPRFPELKLPKLDLEALFDMHKANLVAVQEAQSVLADAAQAIAKVQYGYVEQAVADAKATLASKQLPKAETVKAAGEKTMAATKEVIDLAVAAQKRVFELLTQRTQASVTKLKAVAA